MSDYQPVIPPDLIPCEGQDEEALHEVRCAECAHCGLENKILRPELEHFCAAALGARGVPRPEAEVTARVLVAADLRSIASHGVARLGRYLSGIEKGHIVPGVAMEVVEPTPALGRIDARGGLGQVAGDRGMRLAIEKARRHGVGVVTVANSNHYGIAGYYALLALEADMVGLSLTNSAPLVVPTHGAQALLGTNPIAFGAPARGRPPFLLDMATSVVPRGKIEVYDRNQEQMPPGWVVDERGFDCQNPGRVLRNLIDRVGGGILPLGGRGEEFGGHKGYGLAVMVDILCGVLSGAAFGPDVDDVHRPPPAGGKPAPRVGHFFLALDVARFLPLPEFEARLDALARVLKESPKALGQTEILIHGEKEHERARMHERSGIPVADNVLAALRKIAAQTGVAPPRTLADPGGRL